MNTILKVVAITAGVLFIGSCGIVMLGIGTAANDPELKETLDKYNAPPVITLSEFNLLTEGMTYQQAVSVVGAEGVVSSSMTTPDFRNGTSTLTSYRWANGDLSSASASFDNDRLTSKMQIALK